jgi:hypothetical protein
VAEATQVLHETAGVYWRPRVDARRLQLAGRLWTLSTVAHTVPWIAMAAFLLYLEPLSFPLAIILVAHAWIIPELYAKRGANVLRAAKSRDEGSERTALGFLGDLVGHDARDLHKKTGLILEKGRLGTWLVGEMGAVLVVGGRDRFRRVHCFCVRVEDPELPRADRIAHLLLALREDEAGFATVANQAFSGAPWRLKRRLPPRTRPAVAAAVSTD